MQATAGLAPVPDPEENDWRYVDLSDPAYAVKPEPPDLHPLLYSGHRHVLSGPPESAKTLIAYSMLLDVVRAGHTVVVIDFEMGPKRARLMLAELGATDEEMRSILFFSPASPPPPNLVNGLVERNVKLVVIDAAIGAYDVSGLDDNKRQDAEQFARIWIKPLWIAGIATVLIDHVTKNSESRGKFTIGSERKVGVGDVHLGLDALTPLSRGGRGLVKVVVHKDRPAFLKRPVAAMIDLASDPDNHRITWQIKEPPETEISDVTFRPTFQMERVSRYLEATSEPVSRTTVETSVKGKSVSALRQAMDALVREGYADEQTGPRGARLLTSLRPYRQEEEPEHTTPSDPVRPRPDGDTVTPSKRPPLRGPLRDGVKGNEKNTTPSDAEQAEVERLFKLYGRTEE